MNLIEESLTLKRDLLASLLERVEREERLAAEASLAEFVKQAWHVLEPTTTLVWGWHLDALCQHLDAVYNGVILNLYIGVPPGTTKSTVANVMFPAWCWVKNPSLRFLCAANAADLATRDAVACRRLVESDWYQGRWGERVKLTTDQNVKTWYENSARGHRATTTTGSSVTGRKGDILIVDDPHDAKEVESDTKRQSVLDWWDKSFFNRVNDAKTGRRIVIGQRTHFKDLPGHILERGGFEALVIPEQFEVTTRCRTSIGWEDPRTEEGELLRPERFGPDQIAEALRNLGSIGYAAQHQQRPTPREGALFKKDWFRYFVRIPQGFEVQGKFYHKDDCFWYAVMDPAGGESEHADYTVIGIFVVTPARHLLVNHIDRVRMSVEKVVPHLKAVCEGLPLSYLAIESCFFQEQLFVDPARRTPGLPPVRALTRTTGRDRGNKYYRAVSAVIAVESGKVFFREGAKWLDAFELELLRFTGTNDEHDDQVDVLADGVNQWFQGDHGDATPWILGRKPNNFT